MGRDGEEEQSAGVKSYVYGFAGDIFLWLRGNHMKVVKTELCNLLEREKSSTLCFSGTSTTPCSCNTCTLIYINLHTHKLYTAFRAKADVVKD